jgi:tetratricopeptide (TPR) repeat protein
VAEPGRRLDVKQVLLDGLARLDTADLSASARSVLPALLGALPKRRSRTDLSAAIQRIRADLHSLDDVLAAVQESLDEAVASLTAGSEVDAWWCERQRRIEAAERDGDAGDGLPLWIDAFTEALAAGEVASCLEIIGFRQQRSPELAEALRAIVTTDAGELDDGAFAALDLLFAESVAPLTTAAAVRLGVLRTRVLLAAGHVQRAAQAADEAIERARRDEGAAPSLAAAAHVLQIEPGSTRTSPLEALALAARAEVHLRSGEVDAGRELVTRALRIVAAPVDVHVVAGMLAEADRAWALAEDHYAEALRTGIDSRPSLMLQPTPARLKIATARQCRDVEPKRAETLYASALKDPPPGGSDELIADIHVELGRLLQAEDAASAAIAYADAANSYGAAGLHARAAECYGKACDLQPSQARYWWSQAESLRLLAVRELGVADRNLLEQALDSLRRGLALENPDTSYAWVLVTRALIEAPLYGHRLDQLVLIERSLLVDEDYLTGYSFLIDQLRERGYPHHAYAAARQRHALTPWDAQAVATLIQQCIELERYDEAEDVLKGQLWLEPENVDLLEKQALILLRRDRPEEAAQILKAARTSPSIRLMRADAHVMRGSYDLAQREFYKLYGKLDDSDALLLQGWAAFQSGSPELLDQAIEIYRERMASNPFPTVEGLDLAQMLLVRGDRERGDLEEGERLLREGVANANLLDDLVHLETVELSLLRHRVLGQPHERQVRTLLDSLLGDIKARRLELRRRRLKPDSTAGKLAAARTALADGAPEQALEIYQGLVGEHDLPTSEVLIGVGRAADALLAAGDASVEAGHVEEAATSWARVDAVLPQLPARAPRVAARRCLIHSVEGRSEQALVELVNLFSDEEGAEILAETVTAFASHLRMLWAIHAALVDFATRENVFTPMQRESLAAVAAQLPFSHAYRAGRGDLSPRTASPLVALEVLLGGDHHDLAESTELNWGIPALRDQLAREMGVRIQGVRVSGSDDIDGQLVEFRLFAERIGQVFLIPDTPDRVTPVLRGLEKALRERLYRLIGPDDISLWLEDWSPGSTPARSLVRSYGRERRLALAQVLRMLLREEVPISDRKAILDAFNACDPSSGPLTLLREVRVRLGDVLARLSPPAQRFTLPASLEDRIQAGLAPSGDRWELDRNEAIAIVLELRTWLAGLPAVRRSIVVTHPLVRPFVWRLLAAEPEPVRVLTEEELA